MRELDLRVGGPEGREFDVHCCNGMGFTSFSFTQVSVLASSCLGHQCKLRSERLLSIIQLNWNMQVQARKAANSESTTRVFWKVRSTK